MSDQRVHPAYDIVESWNVPDYHGIGTLYRHRESGAEVFHLANDDSENMFAFAFPTYPHDSTGVAHILEHTVLSGSERYAVKDPFLQLMKGSVNTFLNAMTYPDKTVYPAASPVAQDLFNMMKVYGDAVFFPLLKRELFRQEGHRVEWAEDGTLERTGIVYNEMKGNYSSHDSVVGERCFQSLFPDTIYRHDSGGDPATIPALTYEQFVAFHQRYYHPSNARIVLYGNIPAEQYLELLHDEFLSRFTAQPPETLLAPQPRWNAPRTVEATYPLDGVTDLSRRSSVTLNWLLFPVTETERLLEASVLTEILLGHSGSPLAKALIDSGLGQDLSPVVGLETDLYEAVFSVGLRGTDPEHISAIESLVLDTLNACARDGLHPDAIEGALRRVEFRNREIKGGPNGMRMMRRALRTWMYGAGPAAALNFSERIANLRAALAAQPRLFEARIEELLLSNHHRSTVVVTPDPGQTAREAQAVADDLAALAERLDDADRTRITRESEELAALQAAPDDPAALAAIPFLDLADIPREVKRIECEIETASGGYSVYHHNEFTNGIVYCDVAIDFGVLSPRQEMLLNLLGAAFTEVGLPGVPWEVLSDEINLKTGGISAFITNQLRYRDFSELRRMLVLRVRVLERAWREGVDLFTRIIEKIDFADTHRLTQIVDELIEDMQSALIPSGHYFAGLRASAGLHGLMRIEEGLNGITQLGFLRGLRAELDHDPDGVAQELNELFSSLVQPEFVHVNLTADRAVHPEVSAWLPSLIEVMRSRARTTNQSALTHYADGAVPVARAGAGIPLGFDIPDEISAPMRQFLLSSATVSYVTLAMRGIPFGDPDAPAQDVLAHLLRTGPLWEEIRMKGGAYGAFASSRTAETVFGFASYRDPHTVQTLGVYRRALENAAHTPVDRSALDLAKVSILGKELKPLTPRDAGFVDFRRRLHDIDDAVRQEARDRLHAVTPADIQRAAQRLLATMNHGATVILGGAASLAEWQHAAGSDTITVEELGV